MSHHCQSDRSHTVYNSTGCVKDLECFLSIVKISVYHTVHRPDWISSRGPCVCRCGHTVSTSYPWLQFSVSSYCKISVSVVMFCVILDLNLCPHFPALWSSHAVQPHMSPHTLGYTSCFFQVVWHLPLTHLWSFKSQMTPLLWAYSLSLTLEVTKSRGWESLHVWSCYLVDVCVCRDVFSCYSYPTCSFIINLPVVSTLNQPPNLNKLHKKIRW